MAKLIQRFVYNQRPYSKLTQEQRDALYRTIDSSLDVVRTASSIIEQDCLESYNLRNPVVILDNNKVALQHSLSKILKEAKHLSSLEALDMDKINRFSGINYD